LAPALISYTHEENPLAAPRQESTMKPPRPPTAPEQRLLRNARREGLLILAVWVTALVWSVGAGYVGGYHRDPATIGLVLGIPDWVFWAVVVPWALCLAFSTWFCFGYMADDDLGKDAGDSADQGDPA
jgi:hypothetical protein